MVVHDDQYKYTSYIVVGFSPTIIVNSRLLPVGNPFKIPCVLIFSL